MHWQSQDGLLLEVFGSTVPFRLVLDGLSASQLAAIFKGLGEPQPASASQISCDVADAGDGARPDKYPRPPSNAFSLGLPDGELMLASGGRGVLTPRWQHTSTELLMPQSLNLLLSQQWARLGLMTLHAAVIQVDGKGVLVLGERGSGKSVLAAAALNAGAAVVSDDWVLLGRRHTDFVAERLRGFLMLRAGWAAEQLQQTLGYRPGSLRPKSVLPIPQADARFPPGAAIDHIWLLRRPRTGRAHATSARSLTSQQALAELIRSGMPILFSARFPHERAALMAMLGDLLRTLPLHMLETGTDLVERPAETLSRLTAG